MLIIDDILRAPVRGVIGVFRKVHDAAQQERAGETDAVRTQLTRLYMMLETGQITEETFEAREKDLLDRLDELESEAGHASTGATGGQI